MVIKKIKPLGSSVVTTMKKYAVDEKVDGLITDTNKMAGAVREEQEVIAVGDYVRTVKPGDMVKVNPKAYAVKKFREDSVKNDIMHNEIVGYNIPTVEVDGHIYMMLQDRDIEYIIEEWEEETPASSIIQTQPNIIL